MRPCSLTVLLVLGLGGAATGLAQTPPSSYQISTDVPVRLGNAPVEDADVANVTALGGQWSVLHQLASILPRGVGVDAVTCFADGRVAFSTDTGFSWNGGSAEDEDVLLLSAGGTLSVLVDGSAAGIPPEADLDALHVLRVSPPEILFSLDRDVEIAGAGYGDDDVIRYDAAAGTFSVELRGFDWLGDAAVPADVDGMALVRSGGVETLYLSMDIAVDLSGTVVEDEDLAMVDLASHLVTETIALGTVAAFPGRGTDVDAVDVQTPPGLGQAAIDRQIVNTATAVTWSVVYTDADDDGPAGGSPSLTVDGGGAVAMAADASSCGALCDRAMWNGERYVAAGTVGAGASHTYAIAATDGMDAAGGVSGTGPSWVSAPGDADGDGDVDAADLALIVGENHDANGGVDLDLVRGGTLTESWGGTDADSDHTVDTGDLPAAVAVVF